VFVLYSFVQSLDLVRIVSPPNRYRHTTHRVLPLPVQVHASLSTYVYMNVPTRSVCMGGWLMGGGGRHLGRWRWTCRWTLLTLPM
jgi:hypothetical protein